MAITFRRKWHAPDLDIQEEDAAITNSFGYPGAALITVIYLPWLITPHCPYFRGE